jgi:hypothetical protein
MAMIGLRLPLPPGTPSLFIKPFSSWTDVSRKPEFRLDLHEDLGSAEVRKSRHSLSKRRKLSGTGDPAGFLYKV